MSSGCFWRPFRVHPFRSPQGLAVLFALFGTACAFVAPGVARGEPENAGAAVRGPRTQFVEGALSLVDRLKPLCAAGLTSGLDQRPGPQAGRA